MVNNFYMSDIDFIKNNFIDSYLVSFGIVSQFIELTFDNKNYDSIKINLDCKISSIDRTFEDEVTNLRKYSNDVYSIAYFIRANLKRVIGIEFSDRKDNIIIRFEGSIDLLFDFKEESDDMSFSFIQNNSPNIYFKLANGYIDKSTHLGK